jgi:rhamnosyl/mannosyltransferase
LYVPFQKKVLRMAERIIVSSEKYAKGSGILKPFLGKCVFVPYGVDLKRFGGRKGFLAVPGPVFLFVGRLVEYKGLKYLVRAMRDVEGSLVLAGRGPLLPVLRSQAGRLGVRAYFLPNVSDAELPALYNSCDVFVLPSVSRAEAFGIVQLEAMACGKPVISTFDFVNQHMKTGIVVPPADVSALAGAMRRLCNKQLRSRLGARARRRVRKEFQAGMMVDRILRLYRSN